MQTEMTETTRTAIFRVLGFARCLIVTSTLALSALAQDSEEISAPPAAPIQPTAAAAPATKPAPTKTPEEQRLADLLKLKFDRSPGAILQALTAEPKGDTSEAKALDQFRLHAVAGRWKEAGAFIKTLPEKHAAQVYEYVLKDLDRVPTSGAAQQPQQVNGPAPSPTLQQDDILALADIAPAEPSAEQLKLLAALLKRVISINPFLGPLLQRLDAGTIYLGGKDPHQRDQAAQFLLEAGRSLDARVFCAAIEPGHETESLPRLDRYVACLFGGARASGDVAPEIQRAWELNQMIIDAPKCPADLSERAWRRSSDIGRFLPTAVASRALADLFLKHPEHGLRVLRSVAQQVTADRAARNISLRQKNLELQRQVVGALLPVAEHRAEWQSALDLFALNWMEEADYAKRLHVPPRNQNVQFDDFGNQIFYGNQPTSQQSNPNQLPAIPIADILPTAPDDAWLGALDPSLLPRALGLLTELNLKLESDTKALPFLERIAPLQPKEAQRLANDLLRVWASSHDPQRLVPQRRSGSIYYYNGMYQRPQGIPLTRALQQRNLDDLSTLLGRLRKLPIPPLDNAAIVSAFTIAHSQAEVFREESIERVLGKLDEMKPEILAELLQAMRQRLAGQWRKPAVQQQAKTQRSDAQIDAEVLRGYELLGGLLEKGVGREPKDWRLHLAQAATWFDWAEFQYGKKVDLAIYVEKRDHAFAAFQHSADLYAAGQPSREEKDETPAIYQQWLNANLGASDLGFVTRQQEPSAKHLDRIREAIAALPGDAGERHFAALAKAIVASADTLPANLKAGYMRAASRIVGERPESADIRELVSYYDGLLREIEVNLRVDGDATVGHSQPFGVFLTVRHTAELERENSGGFGKYLRNQSQNNYYNPYGTPPIDYRDDLEKQMREKLSEGFEILSLTFHDEKVQSRGYGRPGWRETPLVYLLLKAKDASVDRIPAMRLDLDFVDKRGAVVLPVESAVQLIDARPPTTAARPMANLEVTQTLDDRTLKEGKLTLEIKATAKGVVPPFDALFDFAPTAFKIDELIDGGAAVQRFDSEGDQLAGASERNWTIKLSADPSTGRTAVFQFPKPKQPDLKVTYKRYQDADLVEVAPELAVAGLPLQPRQIWKWVAVAIVVLVLICWLVVRLRRQPAHAATAATYNLPATVTPFTALELLRKMLADERLKFSKEHRTELAESIAGIEAYYFARTRNGHTAPDLDSIGRHWITRAGGQAG
jgi:hypothetical protein